MGWMVVPVLIGIAWMLGDAKILLAGYWLWATVGEYAYQITAENRLRYGDELLLGLVLVAIVFDQAMRRRRLHELRPMLLMFIALCALLALSHLVNRGVLTKTAVTGVQYYRPFILGYLAYITLGPDTLPAAVRFFLATLFFQLGLNLGWLLGFAPLPHPGIYTGVDFAVGTMGSSLLVGYTTCIGIVLCVCVAWATQRPIYGVAALALLGSFVMTNTFHGYVFLAVMFAVLLLVPVRRLLFHLLAVGGIITLLLLVFWVLPNVLPEFPVLNEFAVRGQELMTGRKMAAYSMHLSELPKDVPVFLLGAGPGNLGCAMADETGYLPVKYHGTGYTQQELAQTIGGSIIAHTHTGLLSIWSDMGPIAFLLYWGAHLYAIGRVWRAYYYGSYQHPWQRAVAQAFIPVMTLYLMVAFMTDLVHTALWGFIPWVWAATVWTPIRQTEQAQPEVVPAMSPARVPG
jgi:hypothetical protein